MNDLVLVALLIVTCGCSLERRQKETHFAIDSTNEIRRVLEELDTSYLGVGTPAAITASNKLSAMKHIAVPMLLERLAGLDDEDDVQREKLGVACALLGTNAYPILNEIVKGMASNEFMKQSVSSSILSLAGPVSFGPVITFSQSDVSPMARGTIRQYILDYVDVLPGACMAELIRLYYVTDKSSAVKDYITLGFREVIYCEDVDALAAIFKSVLNRQDDFLVLEALAYLKRCGRLMPELKEDVRGLLANPNPQIRASATIVMNLPPANSQ